MSPKSSLVCEEKYDGSCFHADLTEIELLPSERETATGIPRHTQRGQGEEFKKKIPDWLTHKRLVTSRQIAKHPEIVERVKAQARENEDIPTRTAVVNESVLIGGILGE